MKAKRSPKKSSFIGRYKSFDDMPDWLLSILGGSTSLAFAYYFYVASKVTPPLLETTNKVGFAWIGGAMWALDGIIALSALFYFWFSKRCGDILYNRWFK